MRKKFILLATMIIGVNHFAFNQENELPDAGNVGIGTTNPQSKLDVKGNVNIDSALIIGDSLTVNSNARISEDLTVTGNAFFKSSASIVKDLDVFGFSNLMNTKVSGTLTVTNIEEAIGFDATDLLLVKSDGSILKSGIGAVSEASYSKTCSAINGIYYNPTWNNGPNKIFVECPEIFVGIGTSTPAYNLDVRGIGYFSNSIRVGNVQTSTFANAALIEGERIAAHTNPLIRLSVRNTDGTNDVRFKVENDGLVYCTALKVRLTDDIPVPDYVFKPSYKLMSISELKTFVNTNSHLPNIPSEKQIREEGLSVDQMQLKLLEKVEELTLYIIQLSEQNTALSGEISSQRIEFEKELESLKNQLNSK